METRPNVSMDSSWWLPAADEFLVFAPAPMLCVAPSGPENVISQPQSRVRLVPLPNLPKELRGIPVFEHNNEQIVFVTHILARVLPCLCRSSRHFGLFRCKVFGQYRRMIESSSWRADVHFSDAYSAYREAYPLMRLKDSSTAITLEGLLKWADSKMNVFVRREAAKCKQGCVHAKCTCVKKY